jgi:hypothetical protein
LTGSIKERQRRKMKNQLFEERMESMNEITVALARAKKEFDESSNAFWDSMTQEERLKAFYSVVKRIYQGDVIEKGSYRHVLYSTFGFDTDSYVVGMECKYLDLHNMLYDAEEFAKLREENRKLKELVEVKNG